MSLLGFLLIPLVILGAGVLMFFKGMRRGLGTAAVLAVVASGVGLWAIFQSRSSTAGIGVLFLPFVAAATGALGWLFQFWRAHQHAAPRALAWVGLLAALALIGWQISVGLQTIEKNQARDAAQAARVQRIDAHRIAIKQLLANHVGTETAALETEIENKHKDDEFLLAALESKFVTATTLDRFATRDDFGVTLTVLRNPNCSAATLSRIYRTHTYPMYFHQSLAAHPNTPPEILRALYTEPRHIQGLDHWFAANPSMPQDLLTALVQSDNINVLQRLAGNPAFDCNGLADIERRLQGTKLEDERFVREKVNAQRQTRCR